jgi:hypothetical protein
MRESAVLKMDTKTISYCRSVLLGMVVLVLATPLKADAQVNVGTIRSSESAETWLCELDGRGVETVVARLKPERNSDLLFEAAVLIVSRKNGAHRCMRPAYYLLGLSGRPAAAELLESKLRISASDAVRSVSTKELDPILLAVGLWVANAEKGTQRNSLLDLLTRCSTHTWWREQSTTWFKVPQAGHVYLRDRMLAVMSGLTYTADEKAAVPLIEVANLTGRERRSKFLPDLRTDIQYYIDLLLWRQLSARGVQAARPTRVPWYTESNEGETP